MNDHAILAPVLSAYPQPIASARWTALGSAGGFSGSRIWRGDAADGSVWALKAHPAAMDAKHLEQVHRWMKSARSNALAFIPAIVPTEHATTANVVAGRCWECQSWMPGRADFHQDPSDTKLIAAVTAVARIHQVWFGIHVSPCPAILRRHAILVEWAELLRRGWQPRVDECDPIAPHARVGFESLTSLVPRVQHEIEPWRRRQVPVQSCIGDVWHEHILFEGAVVSGVIDFAAAKIDHVAADLARLLGSLIPDQPTRMDTALRAYASIRPLPNAELVEILDRSGVVASVANWLRRLYFDKEQVADRIAVANRLGKLVGRIQRWR